MKALSLRKKFAFATLFVVGILGLLELAARGVELVRTRRARPSVDTAVTNRLHPLRFELIPGAVLPANGANATINAAGLRGPAPDHPKRRVRVLCLGDSCTFGYAPDVTDELTYPACLGRRLDAARFEVINGGMPAFGSLDCLNLFLYKLVELKPDYVIVLTGWNDYGWAQPLVERPPPADPLPFTNASALLRLEREVVRRVVPNSPVSLAHERMRVKRLPAPSDGLSEAVFARTERVIAALVRACRDHGAVPILVTYANFTRPDWSTIDSLSDDEFRPALPYLLMGVLSPAGWRRYVTSTNDRIRAVASQLEVPLVEADGIRDPRLFEDLCHLRAAGCAALAERVAPVLLKTVEPTATGASP